MCRRILCLLSLVAGAIGLFGCIAAIVVIWSVNARLIVGSGNVFRVIDNSLAAVQGRIGRTQDLVQSLKISASDIEQNAKDWMKREASERLGSQLAIAEKSERLASGLQQADHWLEVTESSVRVLQQAIGVAGSLGIPVQAEPDDHLLLEVGALRNRLAQVTEPVENVRRRATEGRDEGLRSKELEDAAKLAVRVIATLSSVDSRLTTLRDRLSEIQAKSRSAKAKALRWIRVAAVGITFLAGWMAVGQGSLCYLGWKGCNRKE